LPNLTRPGHTRERTDCRGYGLRLAPETFSISFVFLFICESHRCSRHVIPDVSYLLKNIEKVRGIFLTHGHEDHIGALPYVLKQLNVPVYGTKLTLGIVGSKLKEHGLLSIVDLRCVSPKDVVKLEKTSDGAFALRTAEGVEYQGKAVIIASGKRPRRLNVPGETELTGMGVSYCATCDGPLFADKSVAVVGSGNSALQAAIELANVAKQVYLVSRDPYVADQVIIDMLSKYPNIEEIKEHESKEIVGKNAVEKYIIHPNGNPEQTRELAVQGVFVEVGLIPNSEFAADVVERNDFDEITVDCRARTKIEGIFAAGDVTDGPDKQIVIAAGDGSKAALVAYEYLLHQK
jgi:alkyl hydroperoxide reductase subunit F